MSSDSDYYDVFGEKQTNDYISENLVVKIDDEEQNISFSSISLVNIYFTPLPDLNDTLIFCAFFANHFYFFLNYSYSISQTIKRIAYDQNSIVDKTIFSLKDPRFKSIVPFVVYKNECLLNLTKFLQFSSSIYPNNDFLIQFKEKNFQNDNKEKNLFLLMNAMIEIISYQCAYYYNKFVIINNAQKIKETIEDDYNSTFIAKFFIFRIKTEIPYKVAVDFQLLSENLPQIKYSVNYRMVWGIFQDKLFYIDEDEILYEFNLQTQSFINKGRNKFLTFQNLILACYKLERK